MSSSLFQKYNVAGPRYTSYPTVPYWEENTFSYDQWKTSVQKSFTESNENEGISLYIHLPFCESLCTFCGCHKHITKRHELEEPYIDNLLNEWNLYLKILPDAPIIKEIHLGGGTPTFFSPKHLQKLIEGIFVKAKKSSKFEFSFEGHPNNTTYEHLETLSQLGFDRVSFGVQDYSPKVQKAIHRIQPFENVENVTQWARQLGYTSVSHDLVFGLPFQTEKDMLFTIEKTNLLRPDRISFYSYAHVPWIKGTGQRGFDENDLPSADQKRRLYELGKQQLLDNGYVEIGMDHFALPSDTMYNSFINNNLHRNFMGYTASKTQLMIGLGISSISDSWYGFAQNVKSIKEYYEILEQNKIPVYRGHILNQEDLIIRKHILNLMCHFATSWENIKMQFAEIQEVINKLSEMEKDNLIKISKNHIEITDQGKPFVRNVCMAFDLRLQRNIPTTKLFSMTI
ncbi:oxygen-independent coproporphyrinogen III oxidase [Capnocytophaga catalasegens]|uniref:Coproporphyrinogen-III oxidase n=1 Tax=Capnocytophaga catalasegens TaxID=1004260 RepID=A0AAV5AXR9_9FLAO|nr:oxygen-independent coproporphyrinogen III oxidase [Capnocytophaga catalasegens]GIZ14529.1 coproporphyrinogen-III oxidase [Capnocytophaga catalasegens]GJM50731.1 coproporphyrinogen-III oxidase [Capnocytophaga catalasegens]GJM51884.1 coproporphyrinogen-III oxidase [Capnocytophaga catalasegens]